MLSGFLDPFTHTPGFRQAITMKNLLKQKKKELLTIQQTLSSLKQEVTDLEKNPETQLLAIRNILGYAANNEIIFDFSEDFMNERSNTSHDNR